MALPASGALLAKMLEEGDAIFSTRLGKYPPRQATPPFAPIIIRSDPIGDKQEMIADLWGKYPLQCKAISSPVTNIYQYFDHYDVMLKGQGFLYAVLVEIALSNAIRTTKVQLFAEHWRSTYLERFLSISPEKQDIFTDEEKELHKEDFLKDAFAQLQCLRVAMPLKESQYSETTSGSPVLDTTLGTSGGQIKPVRTISQPLRPSNYGALVQAKRYVSAPEPPPYAVPVGPARPSHQRFHSGRKSVSGQLFMAPANIGYFSTPQSPMTGGFLYPGHDDWTREAPKHTFHQMAPIASFHPDVPDSMRLRPPVPQAELTSSHWKHPDFPMQEQLHPITKDRGRNTIEFRRPRGDSSSSTYQNRSRGFSKPAIGTPRSFGSSVPNPQPDSTNLTIVTGYPQEHNHNVALGHPGAVGPVPYPIFQPSQFVQLEYPRNQQNLTMGNRNLTSAMRTHEGHNQRVRRGSTTARRGRMNFSNDARVLERQDAYRRQEASFESNPYEEQPPDLPLQRPQQGSASQPLYHSSLERHSATHMGRVNYAQGGVIDAGHSVQGLVPGEYAGYILKDSHRSSDFDTVNSLTPRRGHQSSSEDVSPREGVRPQEEEMRLAKGRDFVSDTDGKSHTQSAHENQALVSKHLQATVDDASGPNVAYSGSGGQGELVSPQNVDSVANPRHSFFRLNRFEQHSRAMGGQGLSQYVPDNLKITRIWVGGLPLDVSIDDVRALVDHCGMIADIRLIGPKAGSLSTFAFVTFEKADAAAKAINELNDTFLGKRRIHVNIANRQPFDDAHDAYHGFAEPPVIPSGPYIPGESIARMQPMDGSMDTSPEALPDIPGSTTHGVHSKATHRYQIGDQQHIAAFQKTPRKMGHNNSTSTENMSRSASIGRRIQRSQINASTNGNATDPRSSQSSNSDQQHIIIKNGFQGVHATKDGVADGSPSKKKKKTTDVFDVPSQGPPAHIPESSDNKVLWTMVEKSQQEPQAAAYRGGVIRARHRSFDRPDSTVYPGSDSTSEATGYRASPEKVHGGSPRTKKSQSVRTGKHTAGATKHRKLNSKTFSVEPSDDQSSAAQVLNKSVAEPRGSGRRQHDRYTVHKYSNVGGNKITGTSTITEIPPRSQKENANGGQALDQKIVLTKDLANETMDVIQHQSSSGDIEGPNDSTAEFTDNPQSEQVYLARPRDATPAKVGRQKDFEASPKAEVRTVGTGCSCPTQPVSAQSPATAPSRKSEIAGGTLDSNTLNLRSENPPSVPNTPKSKHKTAGGSQKKSMKNSSAIKPPSYTLDSGPTMAPIQKSTAVISPPKADDESAFPPLGSSDEDKNKQSLKLSAEVKNYYAAKHADYNIKLRAGIRALAEREPDISGVSEPGNIDVQPTIPATSTLDRKENVPGHCNDAVSGRTSERAETASDDATTKSHRNGNIASSKIVSSLPDTKSRRTSPQRRRNADLVTVDLNATAPETAGKEQMGSDGDAWALPKGEKRWSVASFS